MHVLRFGVVAAVAASLALVGAGGRAAPVASAELNHAAVVIDTADGKVRKFCLAFPEESITGAEALRRIESDVVFASYGSKGQAVCALCGVGCPAGDCFCDSSRYWAYHRAGPGGEPYQFSRSGVSTTSVRDGDVEGWRWGSGAPPPPATVGEVCDVPEPPARTASGGASTTTTAAPPAENQQGTTTTSSTAAAPTPAEAGAAEAPAPGPSPAPGAGPASPAPVPTSAAPSTTVVPATGGKSEVEEAGAAEAPPAAAGDAVDDADDDEDIAAVDPAGSRGDPPSGGAGGAFAAAAFVVLLGSILAWRAKLRRANVRR